MKSEKANARHIGSNTNLTNRPTQTNSKGKSICYEQQYINQKQNSIKSFRTGTTQKSKSHNLLRRLPPRTTTRRLPIRIDAGLR